MLNAILFYSFAVLVLGGAILTITRRSAVHSAISLIISLMGVAGLYLLQQAEFLFAVQIVLYIGGIMVLFLFVIMLVNLDDAAKERQFNGQWLVGILCVALVGALVLYVMSKGAGSFQVTRGAMAGADKGNVEALADSLFSQYLLPFEIASVLLLVAVVGSVVMAKKRI
jgi:NADH-quinone oxidoreductase subunit J